MSGIEKDVDSLGGVVIPIKFRRKLGVESNSKVLVSLEDGIIHISPADEHCVLCGEKIHREQKFRLCDNCVLKIKSEVL